MESVMVQFAVNVVMIWISLASLVLAADSETPYPANEYLFSLSRDALLEAEQKFEHRNAVLNEDEQIVDHYLQYLKWREFNATKDTGFPPSRPTEKMVNYIKSTEIYKALKTLPKGGILHSHENHQLSKLRLLDLVWNSPDFQYLYMQSPDDPINPWNLNFFINPPANNPPWINVKNSSYTKEDLAKQQTIMGIMTEDDTNHPTDQKRRWDIANIIFGRGAGSVIGNKNIKYDYLRAMYEQGLEEGITYFETRKGLDGPYVLNPAFTSTNGQQYLDGGMDLDINYTLQLVEEFSKIHPEFIGHRRIFHKTRQVAPSTVSASIQQVIKSMKIYPDHVLGYDLVGQEDAGNSLLFYLDNFLELFDNETGKSKIPLFLHTGETNFLEDLLVSGNNLDPVATLQNTYEALLLNTKRIGHGIGFIKHPYLLKKLKDKNIALEICIVSNQMLGYSADIRNHPGQQFYRMGIPIALAPDDPSTFGYDEATVDWYDAYMAWGLNLGDLKQLAINSLNYSGMTEPEKVDAIENKWRPMWMTYIQTKSVEACNRNYQLEASKEKRAVTFGKIIPNEGPLTGTTKVHIFGRNFETAICQTIVCKFGDLVSQKAAYISNQHIICQAPDYGDGMSRTVTVYVALDGNTFISTGQKFTYKIEPTLPSLVEIVI